MAPVADGGMEASKRMHEYLLSKQRRQEEFWLRKYGKVLQQQPPSVGRPAPNPRLPPLGGSASGQASSSSRGSNVGGGLSADPSGNTLPPLPSAAAAAGGGGAPAGLPPHHHRQPKGHAPHLPRAGTRKGLLHSQRPPAARQRRHSGGGGGGAPSRRLPPLPPEPSSTRSPDQRRWRARATAASRSGNLAMELTVIRAIKAREDVLERLRVAAGKLDAGFRRHCARGAGSRGPL
ncbi:hypothetical protein PLESTF_001972900, partial [Pleodorina starrii]